MLDKQPIPAFAAGVHTVEHIDGRTLDRMLRRSTASQKGVIADDLHTGRLEASPLTKRQSRLLAAASYGYAHTAGKLTDNERAAVKRGQSLAALHTKPSAFAMMARACNEIMAEIGDEDISVGDLLDRVLAKVDRACVSDAFDRLAGRYSQQMMSAVDRYTAPERPLVAAE